MSTAQVATIPSPPEGQDLATVPMKFEVTPIPVTDFDRACAQRFASGFLLYELYTRASAFHAVPFAR